MRLISQIMEQFRKRPNSTSIMVSATEQALGENPTVSFAKLWSYYLEDPTVQNAVNTFRDQIVGSGFYVTANNQRAVNIINDFCNGIDFDNILYDTVGEMLVCGSSFVEMLTPTNLQDLVRVQITTVKKIIRDQFGNPIAIVQQIDGVEHELDPRNFIHFKLFEVEKKPFGIGLFHALAVPQVIDGEIRSSILESIAQIRDAMVRIFDSYASPKDMYVFENASEQFLQDQALKIRNMKKGDSFITNKKFEHKEITIDPRSRFDKYVEFLQTQLELGSQTPAAKLQTTTGYTEASARAVIELVERRIIGIQRRLKRVIEKEIFDRVLIREGLNAQRANLELHWGQPEIPEFNIQDVLRAYELSIQAKKAGIDPLVTTQEARNILQKSGWELLTKGSEEEELDEEDLDQLEDAEEEEEVVS